MGAQASGPERTWLAGWQHRWMGDLTVMLFGGPLQVTLGGGGLGALPAQGSAQTPALMLVQMASLPPQPLPRLLPQPLLPHTPPSAPRP